MIDRREFLKSAAAFASAAAMRKAAGQSSGSADGAGFGPLAPNSIRPERWPSEFDVEPGIINLENAFWGLMPKRTVAVYTEKTAYVNRYNSIWGPGCAARR